MTTPDSPPIDRDLLIAKAVEHWAGYLSGDVPVATGLKGIFSTPKKIPAEQVEKFKASLTAILKKDSEGKDFIDLEVDKKNQKNRLARALQESGIQFEFPSRAVVIADFLGGTVELYHGAKMTAYLHSPEGIAKPADIPEGPVAKATRERDCNDKGGRDCHC